MEKLLATHRHTTSKGLSAYGWAWVKRKSDAFAVCDAKIKKLDDKAVITEVWVCEWKNVPSKHELVYGTPTAINATPNIDFAAQKRNDHLRKPNETKRAHKLRLVQQAKGEDKPHIVLKNDGEREPSKPPVVPEKRFSFFDTEIA